MIHKIKGQWVHTRGNNVHEEFLDFIIAQMFMMWGSRTEYILNLNIIYNFGLFNHVLWDQGYKSVIKNYFKYTHPSKNFDQNEQNYEQNKNQV